MKNQRETEITEPAAPERRNSRLRKTLAWVAVALVLAGILALGYRPRAARARKLAASNQAERHALPAVTVVPVKEAPAETELELPGNVQALTETALFARADGYIKRRLVDIGDRVKTGQLLAEIESPELDQQIHEAQASLQRARSSLRQAEASFSQAQANLGLAEVTARRWLRLAARGVLSEQDGDEKRAALEARKADAAAAEAAVQGARENVTANEATVQRLLELRSFRQVRAPFAGVITARNIDVGSLVSAGSSSSLRELFRLAQTHTLRVFVNVPQSEVAGIKPGMPCSVGVEEYRDEKFQGRVTRTANALETSSRTLLTEVQVVNRNGALLPGMYATVRFKIRRASPPLLIPSAAFRNTEEGPMVAVLKEDSSVHLQPVRLGRDYGAQMEVIDGLRPGQKLITNWTDEIREGTHVKSVAAAKPAAPRAGGQVK
ncbi:MAG: efflux RND transporter periplasmic adaptor subunit [Acidobacteria bacterium]|nr:efflux RND transporter periplasmic adaptor subunit [Acidobacteriota bacterium]